MPAAEQLRTEGRIEAVDPDSAAARAMWEEAGRHLSSAEQVAASDRNGAYALLYDAARKAVTAHMLAAGYRPKNRPGAHEAVVLYAEAVLAEADADGHVRHFDRMRRTRHRSEYGIRIFGTAEIQADLEHARRIVTLAEVPPPGAEDA